MTNIRLLAAIGGLNLLLVACNGNDLPDIFGQSVQATGDGLTTLTPYTQAQTVTPAAIARLRYLAKGQSPQAMRSVLGSPNFVDKTTEVYQVEGTGDQVSAPQRLIVLYALDANTNYTAYKAVDWYLESARRAS